MTAATPPTGLPDRSRTRRLLALAALGLPAVLIAIDISVVAVALPPIARALHPSAGALLWITDSYNYLVAGTMLTMGAWADRIGRRRMILGCAAVFAVASAVGAFAPGTLWLVIARMVMGVAGSAVIPASMSLIGTIFPDDRARVQAMGAYLTVFLVGMTIAPFVGGLLLSRFWWGSVFLIGVPVMLLTLIIVPALVPEVRSEAAPPVDLTSTGQSIVAVLALVYAVKTAVNDGTTAWVWAALAVGALTGVLFVRRQQRLAQPLVDLRALAGSGVGRVLAAMFLTALLMGGTSLFVNLYLQEVQGLTPLQAAGWMVPATLAMIAASNLGPWLNRRMSRHTVLTVMLTVMTAGFAVYAVLPATSLGRPLVAVGSALATFGVGACFPLLMDAVMSRAAPERAGAVAALAQLSNELGIAVGLTVLGSLGTLVYRAGLGQAPAAAATSVVTGVEQATAAADGTLLAGVRSSFTHAYNVVGAVGVAVMILVLALVATGRRPAPDPTTTRPAPQPAGGEISYADGSIA